MAQCPEVTVVIPTYNRARLLNRAIQSVLNQTFSNFEIIVVDDGSTDDTETVVKAFKDPRVSYLAFGRNLGAIKARNTGIHQAKGKYIAFQDSDDEWLPQKLEKQMDAFHSGSPDLGVVYTSFWLIDNGIKKLVPPVTFKHVTEGQIHESLLIKNFVNTPTAIVKKECFSKAGLFENLPRLQEWGLWLRVSKYYLFKHIQEPLVKAYRQPDSITRNAEAKIVARKYILSKYFKEIAARPNLLQLHYFEIGTLLALNADTRSGKIFFLKALQTGPLNIKLILSFLFSVFGNRVYSKFFKIYYQIRRQNS